MISGGGNVFQGFCLTRAVVKDPFLLDLFPAAVAFSLRKLRNATTNVIRVRRDSDNAEQDFTADEITDGTLEAWVGSGNNGFVRTWYDQSGNNNHAEQTTESRQPEIVIDGNILLNSNNVPSIKFERISSNIRHLQISPYYSANEQVINAYTIYEFITSGNNPYIEGTIPQDVGFLSLHSGATRAVRTGTVRASILIANGAVLALSRLYLRLDTADRDRIKTFIDNSSSPTIDRADSNTNFNMPDTVCIGDFPNTSGTVSVNNFISEWIRFTTDTMPNREAITDNIMTAWGID